MDSQGAVHRPGSRCTELSRCLCCQHQYLCRLQDAKDVRCSLYLPGSRLALFPHHPLHSPFLPSVHGHSLDSRHVPRHTSCGSGPYRRSDVPAGKGRTHHPDKLLDPCRHHAAYLALGSKPGIYHHRSRTGRLPLWEVHQADRVRISPSEPTDND